MLSRFGASTGLLRQTYFDKLSNRMLSDWTDRSLNLSKREPVVRLGPPTIEAAEARLLTNNNLKFLAAVLLIIFFGVTFVGQIIKQFIN